MSETEAVYVTEDHADLDAGIRLLAVYRRNAAEAQAQMKRLRLQLEASIEWQYWQGMANEAGGNVTALEESVRRQVVEAWEGNGDKHLHPAVTVKQFTCLSYDPQAALEWCKSNLPKAVKLDERVFEKHAKAVAETGPVPFVTLFVEPRAQIATDLSAYLPEPDETPVTVDFEQVEEIPY